MARIIWTGRAGLQASLMLLAAYACPLPSVAAETTKAAVFGFELIDTSLEGEMQGPQSEEMQRLARLDAQLREALAASDRYVLVDVTPARERIRAAGALHACKRCAIEIGRSLGAEAAITGTVQKVSSLILNINIYVWDLGTGALQQAMSADIRGNTDEAWARGLSYLLRHRLLKESQDGAG